MHFLIFVYVKSFGFNWLTTLLSRYSNAPKEHSLRYSFETFLPYSGKRILHVIVGFSGFAAERAIHFLRVVFWICFSRILALVRCRLPRGPVWTAAFLQRKVSDHNGSVKMCPLNLSRLQYLPFTWPNLVAFRMRQIVLLLAVATISYAGNVAICRNLKSCADCTDSYIHVFGFKENCRFVFFEHLIVSFILCSSKSLVLILWEKSQYV